jgi:hypothetical protein
MEKVSFACKTSKAVKEALINEAKKLEITPSALGHTILKKHVSKQESKPTSKKEYERD